jgi:hypothetical protein
MLPIISFEGTVNFELGQQEVTNYYIYPFDEIFVAPHATMIMSLFDSSGELVDTLELPAGQDLEILIPGWVASTRYDSQIGTGISLKRSLILRVLTPALLVLLFLVTLTIPLIDSLSSAVEVAVALIFGVWGIRQIIFPTEPPSLTAVDIILLGEYFAIVLALSVFPIRSVLEKMKRPQVLDEHQNSNENPDGYESSSRKPDRYFSFHDSKIFHFADCPYLARRKNGDAILSFQEIESVKDSGRRLCRACASRRSYHRKQK